LRPQAKVASRPIQDFRPPEDDVVAQYGPAVRRQAAEHFGVELPIDGQTIGGLKGRDRLPHVFPVQTIDGSGRKGRAIQENRARIRAAVGAGVVERRPHPLGPASACLQKAASTLASPRAR